MSPKISIIIPAYNSESFIYNCLKSVAQQSYPNMEVICIDDGCTDNTASIIKKFVSRDYRFTYLYKEHTNAADARNLGLLNSSGEYVTFLDADDFLEKDIIEKYAIATSTGADIIISEYKLFDDVKKRGLKKVYGIHTNKRKSFCIMDIKKGKFSITNIAVWNKLYKASFIRNNNIYFKSHKSLNDMYFGLVSIALAKSIYLCRNISINYRINVPNSISSNILCTKNIFFNVLSEINNRLCTERNWGKIKEDLLFAEKLQLFEFYTRLKRMPKLKKEAVIFKEKTDSFLKYYLEQ